MVQRVVGGIYYFIAWQSLAQMNQYKSYVYLCELDGNILLAKINSKSFPHTTQIKIFQSAYREVNVIMRDCYLDCGRLIKDAITPALFDQLPEDTFRGFIRVDDLRAMLAAFTRSRTLSLIEKRIVVDSIQNRIFELQ
jgi:hypothetical protein